MIPIEPVKTSFQTRDLLTLPQNNSELYNIKKNNRMHSDISTPYKPERKEEGAGSARAYHQSNVDTGLAYGLIEKSTPSQNTTMRNSVHLQVPKSS
jgi:hypothetical protein